MATAALNLPIKSLVSEYGVFWQSWPQFEQSHGERRLVGYEWELIGNHASDANHVDPGCPSCHHVRSVLLAIANRLREELSASNHSASYSIDSHSNSILCLPALGNRAAVAVSIYVSLNQSNGQLFDSDLLNDLQCVLQKWGIHRH